MSTSSRVVVLIWASSQEGVDAEWALLGRLTTRPHADDDAYHTARVGGLLRVVIADLKEAPALQLYMF